MGASSLTDLALTITDKARYELEFEFESITVNLQDTILIPIQGDRDAPLEDMDIMDFGLVRYSGLFPLRYAGLIPMRFLQVWDDSDMCFKNWAHGNSDDPERITMEDIYTILAELDAGVSAAKLTREEHARLMGNMTKMRDFVAFVADQERKLAEDKETEKNITGGKENIGIENK